MDKEKIIANLAYINMRKDVLLINGSLALSVLFSSCAPKGPEITQVNASGESENNNNSSEQSSSTENLTQEQIAQRTLDNFVATHPEYKGREAGVVNFIINSVDASTVVFETTEAEKAEISERKYVIEGDEVTPFTGAVVWTKETDFDGNERWVRLAGVQFQNKGDTTDTIYTVWYSSPYEDYTKVSTKVDFKRKVFAFNSNDDEYAYWPQVNPPTKIVWSEDMTQTDPSKFEFWNGNDPFMLPVKQVVEGGSKSLFAPAAIESPEPTPAEVREFIPANDIVLVKKGGVPESVHLNENTPPKDVYEDMLTWFFKNYNGSPENAELKEKVKEIVASDPQYEKFKDIGPSSDYELRIEFMKFVLEQSGGLLTISNHRNEKFIVDFNQAPEFVVEKVSAVDTDYVNARPTTPGGKITGMGMTIGSSDKGALQIKIQYRPEVLINDEGYSLEELLSKSVRAYAGIYFFNDRKSTQFDGNLYFYSPVPPSDQEFYRKADLYPHQHLFPEP